MYRFLGTHAYFADWIAFRKGVRGRLLRHFTRPSEGFFQFFSGNGSALAVLVNSDLSKGQERLLFAVNPNQYDVVVSIGDAASSGNWRQLADHERFLSASSRAATLKVEPNLVIPALGCGLWMSGS
jgi:hypothetical protein